MSDGSFSDAVIDFGKNSDDYANYRPGLPESWFLKLDKLIEANYGSKYMDLCLNILDLGCGPGVISFKLMKRYENFNIFGVDISENQILSAKNKLKAQYPNTQRCQFFVGSSDKMRKIESNSIDIVICGQCWPWFDAKATFVELQRVFKQNQNGLLIIAQYCYLPQDESSKVAQLTEELILSKAYNPKWKHSNFNGLYPTQIDHILQCPFASFDQLICYDYDQIFSLLSWIKRINTCNGIHGLNKKQLVEFNKKLEQKLSRHLHEEYNEIPTRFPIKHRIWTVVAKIKKNQSKL